MRARRHRPASLSVTQLEDRTVPAVLDPLPPPAAFDPNADVGLNTLPPIASLGGADFLTGPQAGAPLTLAAQALTTFAPQLGLTSSDVADAILTNGYADTNGAGMFHAYFKQSFNGLEVFNTSIGVHLMPDGRVLAVNGGFVPGLGVTATGVIPNPTVSPTQAVANAAGYFGITLTTPPQLVSASDSADRTAVVSEPEASTESIATRLVYVNTPAGVREGWEFNLDVPGHQNWYDVVVDAATGQVTYWNNWVDHYSASYTVLPTPTKDPTAGPRQTEVNPWVMPNAVLNASPFGWQDTNGVAGADFTDTRGNNVFAQADLNGTNNSTIRPAAGAGLIFNYTNDLTASPLSSQDASVTQLFYMNNFIHDVHAQYGFTEAAGNFQFRNYTGQGLGGDQVQADTLDGSGIDNANFATPPDGTSGRMQMYQFSFSSPFRDGTFDNEVVVHEYGHGVSNRLTGGPANANALNTVQSAGMGEGWSDYWALMFTLTGAVQATDANHLGDWVTDYPTSGVPSRRQPYSYDMTIDPVTFDSFNADRSAGGQPDTHNTGEIWASTLYDMTWLLINKYGFDKDLTTGYSPVSGPAGAGNKLSMQLVMDALKLQPANPTFIEARDAILAADLALTGGQNRREIWEAFARRGLGVNSRTSGSTAITVTTDYSLPPAATNPAVVGQTPAARVVGGPAPSSVTLMFSEPMDTASFSPASDLLSFTGPDGQDLKAAVTGFSWVSPTQLEIDFTAPTVTPGTPSGAQGAYQFVLGPDVRSADNGSQLDQNFDGKPGRPSDTYTGRFQYDAAPLQATLTTDPTVRGAILATFSEPIDPATLQATDLQVSQGTVTQAVVLSNVQGDVRVRFVVTGVALAPSFVTLPYGSIKDPFGFPVEEASGVFGGSFSQLSLYGPAGWEAYTGVTTGTISTFGEVDSYTVDLDAGQTIAAVADQLGGLRAIVSILDPSGVVVTSAVSPTSAAAAYTAVLPVNAPGRYTVQVTGVSNSTGTYRVRALVGAAVEGETQDPTATNDSPFRAENLNPLKQAQGGPGSTVQAVNLLSTIGLDTGGQFGFGDTDDYFSFSATAGQQVTVGLSRISGSAAITLAVTDPAGFSITPVTTPGNFDQAVTFQATQTGTYRIHASVSFISLNSTGNEYLLGLLVNGSMDQEANDTAATAQTVPFGGNLRGAVGGGDEDWYQFVVPAGQATPVYITTFTPGDGPFQPDNLLDPDVQIYTPGANPVLVAGTPATDNAAADGKNVLLAVNLNPGTYLLRVRPSPLTAAPTAGDYVVQVSTGANPGPVNPQVVGAYTVTEGGSVTLTASATDPNGDTLTYSWDLNGDGVFGDVVSQTAAVTVDWPTLLALGIDDGPSLTTIQVRVSDGANAAVTSYPSSLTVKNGDPTAAMYVGAAGTDTTATVDEGAAGMVVRLTSDTDPLAAPTDPSPADVQAGLRYSYDVNGDGLFNDGAGDGTYAGSAGVGASFTLPASTFADNTPPGTPLTIKARVMDKDGGFKDVAVTFTIDNLDPTAAGVAGALTEGTTGTVSVAGAADPSPVDQASLHYTFDLDLNNDGVFDANDVTITAAGVVAYDPAATLTYADGVASATAQVPSVFLPDGPTTIGVRATVYDKDGGKYVVPTTTLPITNTAPTAAVSNSGPVNEGSAAVVTVSNAFDPSAADSAAGFHYAYDFNDDGVYEVGGDVSGVPSYATGAVSNTATIPPSYLDDGNAAGTTGRTVRVRVYDKNDGFTEYKTTVGVQNVPPTAVLAGAPVVVGSPLTVSLVGQADPSVADTQAGFRYSFDFNNNGTFTDAGDVLNSTTPTASFTYQTPGDYTVRARIADKDGGFTDVLQTFTVANVQPSATLTFPATVPEGGAATLRVTASHPSAATTAAGFRYAYDFDGDGVFDLPAGATSYATASPNFSVAIPATLLADGPRQLSVRVRVYEVNGLSADFVAPIQVTSVAPTATFSGPTAPVDVGDKVSFAFTNTTDPSAADVAAGFRYSVDLNNDGDFTDPGEVLNSPTPTLTATFATAGPKVVHGQVTDKDGATSDYLLNLTVRTKLKTAYATGVDAGNAPLVQLRDAAGNVTLSTQVFDPSFTGGVRVAVGDVNGDGTPDVIAGTGPGVVAEVRVVDGATGRLLFSGNPFDRFTGGVFVTAGDMDGDGKSEFAVSPDQSGGPRVVVYRGLGLLQTISFYGIEDPNFRGGARVGMADINGDGKADLLVSAGFMGGPRVAGYEGAGLLLGRANHLFHDFYAFESNLRNGVYLTGGDVNGDGKADLVIGAGPGGAPRVSIFDGAALLSNSITTVASFFTGNTASRGGIRVAVADRDGDGLADVITGEADGPTVSIFLGKNLKTGIAGDETDLFPFSTPMNGVFVG